MQIPCPYCGTRDALEFTWGGQAAVVRPADPQSCSDEEWCRYLFIRSNPRGPHHERWCHTYGCGQWLDVWRDTLTHVVEHAALIGVPRPRSEPSA
ncbi:MAG TPA: sarcosine oxidase subunit delta [Steroidobacteraceae bacterium]|jgi:sarcosine oxidase subunit delta|nr:sarcosine oxidase subunit delta [Steroidobacteraceae bacterium]